MKIAATHSHLNGIEFLLVHHPQRWKETQDVIAAVDAEKCRTKKIEGEAQGCARTALFACRYEQGDARRV
ncbi:MAG TPA: hypothetical protein VKS22_05625 [Candidatus Binataceae bacterium]|nr:hypothetical protein [Candidatus Binataceae bacterium]